MTATVTDVRTIPTLSKDEARCLAETEYGRMVEQLRTLEPDDWHRPTDCEGWDVRAIAGHSVGMASDFTSMRRVMHRMRAATARAKEQGSPVVDAMTSLQVEELAPLTVDQLIARAAEVGPAAARWRTTRPWPLRAMPMKEDVDGTPETWRMGYLFHTILTRDPWMHRIDIARATERPLALAADHDGRIVADVVAEWARRHGRSFRLTLTGPAGGTFAHAGAGAAEELTVDAVEFCRTLSGRTEGVGLLARQVPF